MQGIGPVRAHRLAEAFGSPEQAFAQPVTALVEQAKLTLETAERLKSLDWPRCVDDEWKRCGLVNCRMVTLEDAQYPSLLREVPAPPPVLYVRGTLTKDDEKAMAVVGCRKPSRYGVEAAAKFSRELVERGFTVVSGLAYGIDACAHQAVVEAGGRTVAVLAHGLDRVYPEDHRDLHDRIVQSGAVVSEFPLGVAPLKENFPRRNRLISGLAQGVLVVEAGAQSGALITARWALEQGREVFALPGRYDVLTSQGTNALIQEGAKLVMGINDILEELALDAELAGVRPEALPSESPLPELTPQQQQIYQALVSGARHVDQLSAEVNQPVSQLLNELLHLELKGWVHPAPGGYYTWNEN